MYLTALGLYEAFLDGTRVGDAELTPGYTQYRARVQYQAYDVTSLARPGRHVLAVLLADGWYRGQVGLLRSADQYGGDVALRAQLEVRTGTGWEVAAASQPGGRPGWRTAPSHITAADLIGGQREDRRRLEAVHDVSFDDRTWREAVPRDVNIAIVRSAGALDAWRREFVHADGTLAVQTQASHVRALAFGLVPEELRPPVAARLAGLVALADGHLTTGFLSTPYLLPVLADHGYLDTAYELLLQDTPPSWLTMVDRGATTVWEEWEGVDGLGVPHASLNHYSKGAVAAFLHRYVAGLRPAEPGYRTVEVRPRPGGGITAATARHISPFGPIEVSWRLDGRSLELDVLIPPGTTATVILPGEAPRNAAPGRHRWTSGTSEVP